MLQPVASESHVATVHSHLLINSNSHAVSFDLPPPVPKTRSKAFYMLVMVSSMALVLGATLVFVLKHPKTTLLNSGDPSAIWDAVSTGDSTALAQLISNGANVNARDSRGHTPIMVAVSLTGLAQASTTVDLLLSNGADVHLVDPIGGLSPMHRAAIAGNVDGARALIVRSGAHVNVQSPLTGNTPLHEAVLHKQVRCSV